MKKKIYTAVLAAAIMLSGCGSSGSSRTEKAPAPTLSELLPEKPKPPEGEQKTTLGKMTVSLPLRWRKSDKKDAYIDDETRSAYMLAAEGDDKELPPTEILSQYKARITQSVTEYRTLSPEKTTGAGVPYRTCTLGYENAGNTEALLFVFASGSDYYAVLKGETVGREHIGDMLAALDKLAASAELPPPAPNKEEPAAPAEDDLLTGRLMTFTDYETATVDLGKNGKFSLWYDKNDLTKEQISGKYTVLRGSKALEALEKYNSEFDIDLAAQYKLAKKCSDPLDYYTVIFTCTDVYRWGGKSNTKSFIRLYSGVRNKDCSFSMYDYRSYIKQIWKEKVRTNDKGDKKGA